MNSSDIAATMPNEEQTIAKPRLHGPFTVRRSGNVGYEVVDGNGVVAVWVVGEDNAMLIERLLNAAFQDDARN